MKVTFPHTNMEVDNSLRAKENGLPMGPMGYLPHSSASMIVGGRVI